MDFEKISNYWKNKVNNIAPNDLIQSTVNTTLSEFRHCVLATGSGDEVDATPVHYIYLDECVYIFSEGGQKFKYLANNTNVCVSVFNHDGDFGNIHSVQLYGNVEFVDVMSPEYLRVVENSVYKLNLAYLEKRASSGEPLYLLKIIPNRFKVSDSDFKKNGYDINQVMEVTPR